MTKMTKIISKAVLAGTNLIVILIKLSPNMNKRKKKFKSLKPMNNSRSKKRNNRN